MADLESCRATMRYLTPLRYPGGKSKVANFVKLLFRQNRLLDGVYVEPYAGGAGVALSLLYEEYASRVHINDLDPSIYAFWRSVLRETDALCALVAKRPISITEWRRQRRVQERPEQYSALELGFSTFYLNRTNRSGIITGGAIGGIDQSGNYGMDARFNRKELIQRIERVAEYRDRITLTRKDAVVLIRGLAPSLSDNSLTYLDPPYYIKGTQRLYANYYKPDDHAEVAAALGSLTTPWLVSYDDTPEIRALYSAYRHKPYGLPYTAAARYSGAEIMFFSSSISIPPVEDPTRVQAGKLSVA